MSRQSLSRTARGRHVSATPGSSTRELPSYEPPTFSLHVDAQRELAQLVRKHNVNGVSASIAEAQALITNTACELQEKLRQREKAARKAIQRNRDDEAQRERMQALEQKLVQMQEKTQDITDRMEAEMRRLVDCHHGVKFMTDALTATENDARANASTQASTQNGRSQRARMGDEEGEDAEFPDFTPTDPAGGTQSMRAPKDVFIQHRDRARMRWQGKTLVERYAYDDNYGSFKCSLHDAKYPDDDVAMADRTEWFTDDGAPALGVALQRGGDGDSDDDIAIVRGQISTRCPLTLQEFKDPLMSTKCPHMFEKSAIFEMIRNSMTRPKAVVCPVQGCRMMLSKDDLKLDPVLLRKVQRIQKSRELQEEDEESGSDAPEGTQRRGLLIDDDDVVNVDDLDDRASPIPPAHVKHEPRGTAAQTMDEGW